MTNTMLEKMYLKKSHVHAYFFTRNSDLKISTVLSNDTYLKTK